MMMNIGIDSSAKLSSLPKKISGSSSSERIAIEDQQEAGGDDQQADGHRDAGEQHGNGDDGQDGSKRKRVHQGFSCSMLNGLSVPVMTAQVSAASCSSSRPKPTGMAKYGIHSRTPHTVSDFQLRDQAACQNSAP
jgi:hypothetical protein